MLSKLNPFVRFANYVYIGSNQKYMRAGIDHRIFYCAEGMVVIEFEDKAFRLSKGMLAFVPAGTKYAMYSPNEGSTVTVLNFDLTDKYSHQTDNFTPVVADEYTDEIKHKETIFTEFSSYIIMTEGENAGDKIQKIMNLFFYKEKYYRELSSGILKTALLDIVNQRNRKSSSLISERVIEYLKNHYTENITGKELSDTFKYHPYHIGREIKKLTGMTIKEYITDLRLKESEVLLTNSDKSITLIAAECGFTDAAYFTKIFKRAKGLTPKDYRAQKRELII